MGELREALRSFAELPEQVSIDGNPYAFRLDPPADAAEIESIRDAHEIAMELIELWSFCRQAELYRDPEYGQWGLRLLSPTDALALTESDKQHQLDLRSGELVIGEFLGDGERLTYRPDGRVMIALEIDPRDDWPIVADSISDFLEHLKENDGRKFWDS